MKTLVAVVHSRPGAALFQEQVLPGQDAGALTKTSPFNMQVGQRMSLTSLLLHILVDLWPKSQFRDNLFIQLLYQVHHVIVIFFKRNFTRFHHVCRTTHNVKTKCDLFIATKIFVVETSLLQNINRSLICNVRSNQLNQS